MADQFNSASFNLFEKLAALRKLVEVLQRNKSGGKGRYVNDEAILSKITAGMEKYRLDVYPEMVPGTFEVMPQHYTRTKKLEGEWVEQSVNEHVVRGEMVYRWVNLDDPKETYTVPWIVVGQQENVSQAFGSGLTYCMRYFLLKFFKSATPEDDPDRWRAEQKEAQDEIKRAGVTDLLNTIDEYVKAVTTENNRAELLALIKKVTGKGGAGKATGNYMKITDASIAEELLAELSKTFPIGGTTTEPVPAKKTTKSKKEDNE